MSCPRLQIWVSCSLSIVATYWRQAFWSEKLLSSSAGSKPFPDFECNPLERQCAGGEEFCLATSLSGYKKLFITVFFFFFGGGPHQSSLIILLSKKASPLFRGHLTNVDGKVFRRPFPKEVRNKSYPLNCPK